LLREIFLHVVAHLLDQFAVRHGDLVQMGRVDDQFAPVGDDRFQLVHALAGDPQLVVHGGAHDSTCWNGRGTRWICTCRDRSAAPFHAVSGVP